MLDSLEDDLVLAAAGGDTASLRRVLIATYPPLCRLAIALTGDTKRALRLVQRVIDEGVPASADWQDTRAPYRWTLHRAVFLLRNARPAVGHDDPLLVYADRQDIAYTAAVRSIRSLPAQQVEAFFLSHGEQLDDRLVAVAMDCSTTAAGNHLAEADRQFARVTASDRDALLAVMLRAYTALSPDPVAVAAYVGGKVRRTSRKKAFGRWFRIVRWSAVAIVVVWLMWQFLR